MANVEFWMTVVEGVAVLLLTGSVLFMVWGRGLGQGKGIGSDLGEFRVLSSEELKRLVEESQALCQDLVRNLDEKKALSRTIVEQMDAKIRQLTWLLDRAGEGPELSPAAGQPHPYQEAVDLAEEGFSLSEIGNRLNLTHGEVQLLLDLKAYCVK